MSLDYLNAFRGIPSDPTYPLSGDLSFVLRRRRNVRADRDGLGVELTVCALKAIAQRVHDQSEAIVALQAGGPALGPDDLAAHEAEAERVAARTGTLFVDGVGDWAGLYDGAGRLVTQDHVSSVKATIIGDQWLVVVVNADGAIPDDGCPEDAGTMARLAHA